MTGSARLDVHRRGGDSLLGRYHFGRLHPFTLDERPAEISHDEAFRLQVAPKTAAAAWLEVVERMYIAFAVRPLVKNLPRAIQKPPKVYFFDNADVLGDEGARFENLIATHLLKRVRFLENRDGFRYELRYIRDKEGGEVDFAIIKDGAVDTLVEAKWSNETPSRHRTYYAERLRPRCVVQIVANLKRGFGAGRIEVTNPKTFFADPPWA